MRLFHAARGAAAMACVLALGGCAGRVDRSDVHAAVTAAALAAGVPVDIAHAVVRMESNYDPRAKSRAGACGLMQLLPATAREMGEPNACRDMAANLRAGMRYLALVRQRSADPCAALSLYHLGRFARPRCTSYGSGILARVVGTISFKRKVERDVRHVDY